MAKRERKPKPRRKSFVEGMKDRFRETAGLGRVLVTEPRAFPSAAGRVCKRSLATLWQSHGGGLYAAGFVVTFLWLEAKTLVAEVASSTSIASFFTDQFLEFVFRFTVQSITNTVGAFIWPAYLVQMSPLWGGLLLGGLYLVFPRYLQPLLTRWLFEGDEQAAEGQDGQEGQEGQDARG